MTDGVLFFTGVVVFSLMIIALGLTIKEFKDLSKRTSPQYEAGKNKVSNKTAQNNLE